MNGMLQGLLRKHDRWVSSWKLRSERGMTIAALIALIPIGMGILLNSMGVLATALSILALAVVGAVLVSALLSWQRSSQADRLTGLAARDGLVGALNEWLGRGGSGTDQSAVLLIEIDDFKLTEELYDRRAIETVLRVLADRLGQHLRVDDVAARLEGHVFAVALCPTQRLTLESLLQLANRLQQSVAAPFETAEGVIRLSVCVGFAMSDRVEQLDGPALIQAATSALAEAQRNGPGAIRSYSDLMRKRIKSRTALCGEIDRAFKNGEVTAFFQPQIRLDTNEVTGFETLTRWIHPDRGIVSPAEFLPALRQAQRMRDLGDLMVTHALDALLEWDKRGFAVPKAGVNFSMAELHDQRLVDRVAMMLDQRNLAPERLVIEVLETVVANTANDIVAQNLSGLADLGCGIDLDDFGTGYASITNIRKLSIGRIKIDRSFITQIDHDEEQQNMVAAILTMAERLGLETLSEGVETPQERAMLAQLGCVYAQGFLFARPMPLEESFDWLAEFQRNASAAIPLARKTG